MRVSRHPASLSCSERRGALLRPRICDVEAVEGFNQPFPTLNLFHADRAADLLRKFGKRRIALTHEEAARTLGGIEIDSDAAQSHLLHHRQDVA